MDSVNNSQSPPVLPGSSMLPPMETSAPKPEPPKGKPKNKRQTGDRFAVLNSFIDCSMVGLTKAELATWFVLY